MAVILIVLLFIHAAVNCGGETSPAGNRYHLKPVSRETANKQLESILPLSTVTQTEIPWVSRMPRLPDPLIIRDWPTVAVNYYRLILDQKRTPDGKNLAVLKIKHEDTELFMPSYMESKPNQESFTCLSAIVGSRLVGMNPSNLAGVNYVQSAKNWYDPVHGIYRHGPGDKGPVIHSGIYGYWSTVYGIMLAAQYPDDKDFQLHAQTTAAAYLKIAKGLGCPDAPDFTGLGYNFDTGKADGRNEPMNRLGNAPTVAWTLLIGHILNKNQEMLDCSRSIMQWYVKNPGRYELTHIMGPMATARLNAEYGETIDLNSVLAAWFGDGDQKSHPWHITAGSRIDGITCDGIDGAKWNVKEGTFHGFTMGTLVGPAWLVPVVRYDQQYAASIARYALHAAASARLLQGYGLDWDHQDHKDWKDRNDPDCLLFYEALQPWEPSDKKQFRPYATGDPIKNGWNTPKVESHEYLAKKKEWFSKTANNISLYMGNHVGFLGGICQPTDVPGILRWDCVATDWFHSPAYPTWLYFNPHQEAKTVTLKLQNQTDLYDTISRKFIAKNVKSVHQITLSPGQAVVLVETPPSGKMEISTTGLKVNGVVIDYQAKSR